MRIHRSRIRAEAPRLELRRGLSLFEVIISLTIFVASAAAIGQLVSGGVRGALRARLETEAAIRAESAISEFVAGVATLQSTGNTPFQDSPEWTWSASVSSTPQIYLYMVEVSVSHVTGGSLGNVTCTLRRLVRDPGAAEIAEEEQLALQEEQAAAQAAAGGSTGGASTGSSGGQQ